MNERNILLGKIKKYDFTLKELNLYLDTHPNCDGLLKCSADTRSSAGMLWMNI